MLKQFKPDEYRKYKQLPLWQQFDATLTESKYEAKTIMAVDQWVSASKKKFGPIKKSWKADYKQLEDQDDDSTDALTQIVGRASVPLLEAAIQEQVAILFSNYPRPIYIAQQESENAFVGMLSTLATAVMEDNNISTLMFDVGYDLQVCNFGVLKQTFDFTKKGVFDKGDRITLSQCDPLCCHLDPTAKRLRWEDMNFFVYDEYVELGELRKRFPDKGFLVDEDEDDRRDSDDDFEDIHGEYFKSPISDPTHSPDNSASRIRLREAWVKDSRLKFVATDKVYDNTPGTSDYDPELPSPFTSFEIDDDGYVDGEWVPAYPDGRMLIIAGNHVIVDAPNPFSHGQAPYSFFKLKPSRELLTKGFVNGPATICARENAIVDDMWIMAKKEIKRPFVATKRTFIDRLQVIDSSPDAIIIKQEGDSLLERMPPSEIPMFPFTLLQLLGAMKNKVLGVAAVNQGQLAEGAQLSGQAVSSLQDSAQTLPKMKAEYVAEGMKHVGFQMMHNLKQNYEDEDLQCTVTLPNGEQMTIKWNENNEITDKEGNKIGNPAENYMVKIESGSGVPGGQQQAMQQAYKLHDVKAVDDQFLLQACKIGDWQQVLQRKMKTKLAEIQAEATGKQMGVNIKQYDKADEKAGRREII